jgi:hypothetical protein
MIVRTTCFGQRWIRSSTSAIHWLGWLGRSIGSFWLAGSARCVRRGRASRRCRRVWWPGCSFSSTCTICPTSGYASAGLRTPYFQFFCGEVVFRHELPFERSSLTRWRQRLGEAQLAALLQESVAVAHKSGALANKDLERVAVDTTVQEKAIAHPTDARLTHRAIEKLADLARREGVRLRQSYRRVAKRAAIMVGRYTHAHQFKRARRELRFLRTRLGRIIRDIRRKIEGNSALEQRFARLLALAHRVRHQDQHQRGPKIYSLHAPEVECIGRGKARAPYEFGCKVSITTPVTAPKGGQFVLHAKALHGNPFDGHTLGPIIADLEKLTGIEVHRIHVDKGYAATTIRTASASGSVVKCGASPSRSAARCGGGRPSSRSSVISRTTTACAATTSRDATEIAPTPCSPPLATTSACSCAGSNGFGVPCSLPWAGPSPPHVSPRRMLLRLRCSEGQQGGKAATLGTR